MYLLFHSPCYLASHMVSTPAILLPTASAGCDTAEALTCLYTLSDVLLGSNYHLLHCLGFRLFCCHGDSTLGCLGMHGWTLSTCELCTPTGVCATLQYSTGAPIILCPALSYRYWICRARVASCGGNLQLMDSCCVLTRVT